MATITPERLTYQYTTMERLLMDAYGVGRGQIKGAPAGLRRMRLTELRSSISLPRFRRVQRRQVEFLAANPVHFFPQNGHDLQRNSLAERKIRINSGRELPYDAGPQQQFVRNDLGVCRVFTQGWDKVL